jgi:hypothetical protein
MNEYEQVKLLYDYTKFHIGIYVTLGTILIAALNAYVLKYWAPALWLGIACIGVAGLAGGVIASTLPERTSLKDQTDGFFKKKTGFWGIEPWSGRAWTRIEHAAFWLGIVSGLGSFAVCRS